MMDAKVLDHQGVYAGTLMNDAGELIACARRGDDDAFRLIFEQNHRFILRFIYGMVGVHELAEELTQETFLRAYAGLHALRDDAKLTTWLCGIARNVALHALRARRKERPQVALDDNTLTELSDVGSGGPDDRLLHQELKRAIHDALGALDEDKRLVFTLKALQQRSYDEIAAITGHSVPKLKTDLHRAKAEMRRLLHAYLEVRDEV
jgi:RNA polymerase sigma-70 factor (ECF subfamily)